MQQRVFIIEQYFKNNESLGMKHIFTSMALLIAKIAVFGRTHVWLAKNKCIHNVLLFGADFEGRIGLYFFENEAG